jgi:hypothetical protein
MKSKIIYKIGILAVIEIIFIIGSFGVLAYFQSQGTFLGNSINIAGKNRFLTANVLFEASEYLTSSSSLLLILLLVLWLLVFVPLLLLLPLIS